MKRVYNESIDPITQIDEALVKAQADGKKPMSNAGLIKRYVMEH